MDAVKANDPEGIDEWAAHNPNIVSHPDKQGWTPIQWASNEGHLEAMRALIKH
jgi:ankyrin repeat protein